MIRAAGILVAIASAALLARAQPASRPGLVEFPGVTVDVAAREVRVTSESLAVTAPLEFFCVARGGPEHEAVLRTSARASHIHAGLLLIGLEPGHPARYVQETNTWLAPTGAAVRIECEWTDAAGQTIRVPAERLMRGVRDAAPMPPAAWVFAGSTTRSDGVYLADPLGYTVSLVNFEHALIDVPELVSSANETLEWQVDPTVCPPRGTAVTMILSPDGRATTTPTTRPGARPE